MSSRLNSPQASPRATPKNSQITVESVSAVQSEKPIARMFAGHMVQAAGLRVIMLLFASSSVEDITNTYTCKTILAALVHQATRPSSLEVGVPLTDLCRAGNVMLASAMGQASPWETNSAIYEDNEIINTSDEELDDDDDDDDMDTETEEDVDAEDQQVEVITSGMPMHPGHPGVAAIETVLMQQQMRMREHSSQSDPGNQQNNMENQTQGQQTMQSRRTSILRPAAFETPPQGPAAPPPPPSPITQLIEMGFSMAHVRRGMRSLNIDSNQNRTTNQISTQIAMLAAWLIENPQEPGEEPNASQSEPTTEAVDAGTDETSAENARPLFDFDPIPDTFFDVIDQSSGTIIMDGTESTTSIGAWPGNVASQAGTSGPSIIELPDDNPRQSLK